MQTGATLKCDAQDEQVTSRAEVIFSPGLENSGLPARGLFGSLLVHVLFVSVAYYLPWSYWMPSTARLVSTESMIRQHEVLILPDLHPASNSQASNVPHATSEKPAALPSTEAIAAKGVVYKGEQLIVSSPPHPDNFIQTIRQPDLVSPPKLPRPLPFPAMVAMAPAITLPTPAMPQLPASAPAVQLPHSADAVTVHPLDHAVQAEAPKLPMPVLEAGSTAPPKTASPKAAAAQVAPPHASSANTNGSDARNILIVDAVEVPPRAVLSVPPGELYGAFTVTPGPLPPSGINGSSSTNSGNKISGSDKGPNTGIGTGAANEKGTGHGEAGTAKLPDSGHGSGSGAPGNGRGTGSSGGNSPFPDIVIQGGSGNNNVVRAPSAGASPRQTSYGITIVANGASGGGFKDFGVFRNEASYTVYLDMADAGARGTNWTMQYAVDSHATPGSIARPSHSLLVPPFATSKLLPQFAPEAVARNKGSLIVIFGVINTHGSFDGLRVMQSPDAGLSRALLDALVRWTFRPAEIEETAVPVKVLLGIPVTAVPLAGRYPSAEAPIGLR